jgi:hypothetical protein
VVISERGSRDFSKIAVSRFFDIHCHNIESKPAAQRLVFRVKRARRSKT